jgi:6-phosphogluconolactonase/glucosamine-6-phosphate isomerase/deaminase
MMPNNLEIETLESSAAAIQSAANTLTTLLHSFQGANIPTLFLCSGGSALKILDAIPNSALGSFLTVGVLDERYSTDEKINNFAQLSTLNFYLNCQTAGCKFIDSRVQPDQTIEQLADHLDRELKVWKYVNQRGKIIITQGIGPDGHTSGIMPFPEDKTLFDSTFVNTERNIVSYNAGTKNLYPLRITTTIPFLKTCDYVMALVCGPDKDSALKACLKKDYQLNNTPGAVIQEEKNAHLFTDINLTA